MAVFGAMVVRILDIHYQPLDERSRSDRWEVDQEAR